MFCLETPGASEHKTPLQMTIPWAAGGEPWRHGQATAAGGWLGGAVAPDGTKGVLISRRYHERRQCRGAMG